MQLCNYILQADGIPKAVTSDVFIKWKALQGMMMTVAETRIGGGQLRTRFVGYAVHERGMKIDRPMLFESVWETAEGIEFVGRYPTLELAKAGHQRLTRAVAALGVAEETVEGTGLEPASLPKHRKDEVESQRIAA